jgi:hypothetical protein
MKFPPEMLHLESSRLMCSGIAIDFLCSWLFIRRTWQKEKETPSTRSAAAVHVRRSWSPLSLSPCRLNAAQWQCHIGMQTRSNRDIRTRMCSDLQSSPIQGIELIRPRRCLGRTKPCMPIKPSRPDGAFHETGAMGMPHL